VNYLFNIRANIWRKSYTDDGIGGAVETGTIVYNNEWTRMDSYMPRQIEIGKEGKETDRNFTFFFRYNRQQNLDIRENDVIEIIFPEHHIYYGQTFRVRGVGYEAFHPNSNGLLEISSHRIKNSRGANFG